MGGEYRNDKIVVRFDSAVCSHSANCVTRLPAVFNADRKPWVQVDAADAETIAQVVPECPSGALTYELLKP